MLPLINNLKKHHDMFAQKTTTTMDYFFDCFFPPIVFCKKILLFYSIFITFSLHTHYLLNITPKNNQTPFHLDKILPNSEKPLRLALQLYTKFIKKTRIGKNWNGDYIWSSNCFNGCCHVMKML